MISATAGIGAWCFAGYADWANVVPLWIAWWLRDAAGLLVVTPVVVLWASGEGRSFARDQLLASAIATVGAIVVGVVAFSPLI